MCDCYDGDLVCQSHHRFVEPLPKLKTQDLNLLWLPTWFTVQGFKGPENSQFSSSILLWSIQYTVHIPVFFTVKNIQTRLPYNEVVNSYLTICLELSSTVGKHSRPKLTVFLMFSLTAWHNSMTSSDTVNYTRVINLALILSPLPQCVQQQFVTATCCVSQGFSVLGQKAPN